MEWWARRGWSSSREGAGAAEIQLASTGCHHGSSRTPSPEEEAGAIPTTYVLAWLRVASLFLAVLRV